jgi:hypothetical protein
MIGFKLFIENDAQDKIKKVKGLINCVKSRFEMLFSVNTESKTMLFLDASTFYLIAHGVEPIKFYPTIIDEYYADSYQDYKNNTWSGNFLTYINSDEAKIKYCQTHVTDILGYKYYDIFVNLYKAAQGSFPEFYAKYFETSVFKEDIIYSIDGITDCLKEGEWSPEPAHRDPFVLEAMNLFNLEHFTNLILEHMKEPMPNGQEKVFCKKLIDDYIKEAISFLEDTIYDN